MGATVEQPPGQAPEPEALCATEKARLLKLGTDLASARSACGVTPETRKRILRAVLEGIVVTLEGTGIGLLPAGEPVLVAKTLEDALRGVPLLAMVVLGILPSSHSSMSPVNPSSFGRRTGAERRYPGGTENSSIFLTLSRETPK